LIIRARSAARPADEAISEILAELKQIELMAVIIGQEVDTLTGVGSTLDEALSFFRVLVDTLNDSMDQLEAELRAVSR
jgi:hypothetical protein